MGFGACQKSVATKTFVWWVGPTQLADTLRIYTRSKADSALRRAFRWRKEIFRRHPRSEVGLSQAPRSKDSGSVPPTAILAGGLFSPMDTDLKLMYFDRVAPGPLEERLAQSGGSGLRWGVTRWYYLSHPEVG
jgi:hypothetical protein